MRKRSSASRIESASTPTQFGLGKLLLWFSILAIVMGEMTWLTPGPIVYIWIVMAVIGFICWGLFWNRRKLHSNR